MESDTTPPASSEPCPSYGPGWEAILGNCRDVLPALPAGVFDACVTDPPYGLGMFAWDAEVPGAAIWREVLRVLKPGAALVAFAGRRTYHHLALAVEEAGFRVTDQAPSASSSPTSGTPSASR